MKITNIVVSNYEIPLMIGSNRQGALIKIEDDHGNCSLGDIAPLPQRNAETLQEAIAQVEQKKNELYSIEWEEGSCLATIARMNLFPSFTFALESALLSILKPLSSYTLPASALLMGNSVQEILSVAERRKSEGFTNAKLKIGQLSLDDAYAVISQAKDLFRLRIDVNSRWDSTDVFHFFSHFPLNTFEYVEDPLSHLSDLKRFPHPLAIEEPLLKGISLSQLKDLPTLAAIVYKPTVLGGILVGQHLKSWADHHGVSMVLSSSFESDVGHFHLAAAAYRLGITSPIGIGTYHYLGKSLIQQKLHFSNGIISL